LGQSYFLVHFRLFGLRDSKLDSRRLDCRGVRSNWRWLFRRDCFQSHVGQRPFLGMEIVTLNSVNFSLVSYRWNARRMGQQYFLSLCRLPAAMVRHVVSFCLGRFRFLY
jgi:hypothetical protein